MDILLYEIVPHLDIPTFFSLSLTCNEMHKLWHNITVWKLLCLRDFGVIGNYEKMYGLVKRMKTWSKSEVLESDRLWEMVEIAKIRSSKRGFQQRILLFINSYFPLHSLIFNIYRMLRHKLEFKYPNMSASVSACVILKGGNIMKKSFLVKLYTLKNVTGVLMILLENHYTQNNLSLWK